MTGNSLPGICTLFFSFLLLCDVCAPFDSIDNGGKGVSKVKRSKDLIDSQLKDGENKGWNSEFPRELLAGRGGDPRKRKDFREIKDLLNKTKSNKQFGWNANSTPANNLNEKIADTRTVQPGHIYLGCVSTWRGQKSVLTGNENNRFNISHTPLTCAKECQRLGNMLQVVFLKGIECQCTTIYEFESEWVDDQLCNIPCHDSTERTAGEMCGGNLGYSVYCFPGPNYCGDITRASTLQEKGLNLSTNSDNSNWVLERTCTVCDYAVSPSCKFGYINPGFDYFPANSPEACVKFCKESIVFVSSVEKINKERPPTPFALLTYWNDTYSSGLPICRCLEQRHRHLFTVAEDDHLCGMACPGDSDAVCGGLQLGMTVYSTIYCVDGESDICHPEKEDFTTTTPEPTTNDPCSEFDCDIPTNSGETTEATTTEFPPTTSDNGTMSPTTTITPTTTIVTTRITTTFQTKISTAITTTMTPTTTPTTTSTPPQQCEVKCEKVDSFGHKWKTCANTYARVPCWKLANNATGIAQWYCLDTGEFATPFPNVSNCFSPWVKEREEKIEEIKDMDEASIYMRQLEEDCRNSMQPDSTTKYFGHDISNITSLVDLVFKKIRAMKESTKLSSHFEKILKVVENAVNINVVLMQHRKPWEYLSSSGKSSASTNVIESTESALFNLTDEFTGQNFSKMFLLNEEDANHDLVRFLILAETFNKNHEFRKGNDYEFPPPYSRTGQDSYIKLPTEWRKSVLEEKVEIAAMSIDPEYVSYMMPGQFELASSTELEGEDDYTSKLINGKLISFSLTSSSNFESKMASPRMTFTGKGVEIIFYHDIEAWGGERHKIHRRLHYKEKPRAVLGTTQCVFWDTTELNWSSKGCEIVYSSRYKTVCECSHLTSFAVLMDVHNYVGKQYGLEILTLILCPLSEIGLFLCILILSSVNNLQKIRTTITRNLAACLFVGNALVLFVLDRNYFDMNEGLCIGAAMFTHYVFLCAFMWMLIEGVQLYRMVVHVFDSGKSYLKHFAIFAYGSPLLAVSITATTGYLRGDKPYGGDVYCWLEGSYIWSFMAPVAVILMINLIILFIALKTAYQVKQSKKHSPTFFHGKIKSYKTWLKGCFSLTCILGLTWIVGFFTLMRAPAGVAAAYLFTVLNSSQGIFIFLFNCVFNEKVRSYAKRSLSSYIPSWLSSSVSSNQYGNDDYCKQSSSPAKTDASALSERSRKRLSKETSSPVTLPKSYKIPKAKLSLTNDEATTSITRRGSVNKPSKVDFNETVNVYAIENYSHRQPHHLTTGRNEERSGSIATISSVESTPNSTTSENGHISSDTSQSGLISAQRSKLK